MPRQPRVIPVSDEEYAAQKAAVAARCVRYEVIGDTCKIRDAITRESRQRGEFVMLDPETTIIAYLEHQKMVRLAPEAKAKAKDA